MKNQNRFCARNNRIKRKFYHHILSPVCTEVATAGQLRKVKIADRLQRSQKGFAEVCRPVDEYRLSSAPIFPYFFPSSLYIPIF